MTKKTVKKATKKSRLELSGALEVLDMLVGTMEEIKANRKVLIDIAKEIRSGRPSQSTAHTLGMMAQELYDACRNLSSVYDEARRMLVVDRAKVLNLLDPVQVLVDDMHSIGGRRHKKPAQSLKTIRQLLVR